MGSTSVPFANLEPVYFWGCLFDNDKSTPAIYIAPSSVHGWGVFAAKDFAESELVHESPGRLINGTDAIKGELADDLFVARSFETEDTGELSIIGLGFSTIHNHADDPNIAYYWERSERHGGKIVGTFYTLRPIARGEEMFSSYGDEYWDESNLTKSSAEVFMF